MRISTSIDNHPKRDEIIRKLLDTTIQMKDIAEEYGLNRNLVSRARKRARESAGAIVAAHLETLVPASPKRYAETIDNQLSAVALADDLGTLKAKLRGLQSAPGISPAQIMQAVEGERKVIESLIRMAELAERHRDISTDPRYQRLQAILAGVMRHHPDAADYIRSELRRSAVPDDIDPDEPDTQDDTQDTPHEPTRTRSAPEIDPAQYRPRRYHFDKPTTSA